MQGKANAYNDGAREAGSLFMSVMTGAREPVTLCQNHPDPRVLLALLICIAAGLRISLWIKLTTAVSGDLDRSSTFKQPSSVAFGRSKVRRLL
jgi:hypothetical protein